ncbi:ComF family protein [Aliiglaciecola sp. CAU 1673]|uniref:ComF family protein n=1 Tax=Aliiglaciecola sp. CAU 1673 TaxID=3032595 RepID=UPI0023DC4470|nr:ComF family protein [Aliiglaciecola sp. CAU 1673]MDF2179245.1 ComF family protein [Aliiglaciecola sp. CAU 1673]
MTSATRWLTGIQALLPWQSCLLCGLNSNTLLCETCQADLPLLDWHTHPRNLLNWPKATKALGKVQFDSLLTCSFYQWPMDHLLTGLKFSQRLTNAKALAGLFYQHCLADRTELPEIIVPVPLHSTRYQQRKYNQAAEMAKYIAALSSVSLETGICRRRLATVAQTELSGPQRRQNLKNAFEASRPPEHKRIAIFDDIVTTGATVNSLCRTLKKANPDLSVEVWCIALSL